MYSTTGTVENASPVTFLTEDEKMMKETGLSIHFPPTKFPNKHAKKNKKIYYQIKVIEFKVIKN